MEIFRYSTSSFKRAVQARVFGDRKVELLGGVPHVMTAKPPHIFVVERLPGLLVTPFPADTYKVRTGQPVALARGWMPYPDASVILAPADAYLDHLPTPQEIRLLVEVSDTTYALDRGRKLKRYARAGIPESWIVNIPDRFVQVFTDPQGNRYGASAVFREGESVMGIAVEDLLPPT